MENKPTTIIDEALLESALKQARSAERKRALHFIHAGKWEHAHRSLNAFTPPTYVQAHRHLNPSRPKLL
ncbi:MAG: hypothetical protein HYV77_02960 [Candidatus Wildermuthbacteria bacterium]|nr:hypothetical protein [Candidatus Wildermuthbacteria bacterium]